ncbi:uncharacterized protein LOC134217923 [Armigeres subalbatus]|uniref:uncharacterized protein LOC134217923 n=1 Tax=Armigeres subalbatus TaxID=124917 RepID=UPI002ED4503A
MQSFAGNIILLLLGVLSYSFARNIFSRNNQLDGDDSDEDSSEENLQDLLGHMQTACYANTGSDDTFKAIVSHFYGVPVCVLVNMDIYNLIEDLDGLDNQTRNEFFPKYCPQMRSTLECIEPLLRDFRKCLPDEDALVLRAISHAMPEAIDLICDKNGEILFVEDANYTACIDSSSNYINECSDKISNATNAMNFQNQCSELVDFRTCLAEKLTHCNGPRLMDVFDVIYRAFIRASRCSNLVILPNDKKENAV